MERNVPCVELQFPEDLLRFYEKALGSFPGVTCRRVEVLEMADPMDGTKRAVRVKPGNVGIYVEGNDLAAYFASVTKLVGSRNSME